VSQHFEVHPQNPQPRLLKQAAQILREGGIAAVPTDSSYALSFIFPHRYSDLELFFEAFGLQELINESWGIDNLRVEIDDHPWAPTFYMFMPMINGN
jgi:hypothetical protein